MNTGLGAPALGAAQQEGMANSKENTIMGRLDSIARFNNIKLNYQLVQEKGPAHQKVFTLQLTFGDETYQGTGTSIESAQHDAAQKALDECQLPIPERKEKPAGYKLLRSPNKNALPQTVQLNSYSQKTGVGVDYTVLNSYPAYELEGNRKPPHQQPYRYSNNTNQQGGTEPRRKYPNANPLNPFQTGPRPFLSGTFNGAPAGAVAMGPRPRGPRVPGPINQPYNHMNYTQYDMTPMFCQRLRSPYPQESSAKLTVGVSEFVGQVVNQRFARPDAATKVLKSADEDPVPIKKDQEDDSQSSDRKVTFEDDQTKASSNVKTEEDDKQETVPGSQQGSQIPDITPGLFPMMPVIKPIQTGPFPQPPSVPQPQTQALNTDIPSWQSAFDSFETVVQKSFTSLKDAQKQLYVDLGQAIEFQSKRVDEMESKMAAMGKDHANFSAKISQLEDTLLKKDEEINKLERMSRRNNFRILGVPQNNGENVESIVKDEILPLFDNPGIVIERCHRYGRGVNEHPPHILVRCLSYPMKVDIMKNCTTVLKGKAFFIDDDLTKMDLTERKKWATQVKHLYDNGTRLHFRAGKWRDGAGKPYTFENN